MESFLSNPYVGEIILILVLVMIFAFGFVSIRYVKRKGDEVGLETKGIVKLINTVCNIASEKAVKKLEPKDEDLKEIHNQVKDNLTTALNKEANSEEKKEDPKPIKEETK